MAGKLKVRAITRKHIDEDKLAMAFMMLAKTMAAETQTSSAPDIANPVSHKYTEMNGGPDIRRDVAS